MNPVCARIKEIRKDYGLSQVEFAARLGVTNSHISGIERGKTVPSEALLKLICKEYRITENWLKYGVEPMMQEDEDLMTEDTIEAMFSEDPLKEAGFDLRNDSNRVRLLWAQIDLHQRRILAQRCNGETERYEYFALCEKLFRDISEMVAELRTDECKRSVVTYHGEKFVPISFIGKDRIIKDLESLEMYIFSHIDE